MKNIFRRSIAGAKKYANKSKIVIFLDLDGVLADFDDHLQTHNHIGQNGKPLWDKLDHNWFLTIPVYKGAQDFYKSLSKMAKVKFLTAPTMSTGSISGKAEWIQKMFLPHKGKWALMDFIITPSKDKQFLAGPTRILVDDRIKNIEEWQEAGGIGIHHQGDFAETLAAVKKAIDKIHGHGTLEPVDTPKP